VRREPFATIAAVRGDGWGSIVEGRPNDPSTTPAPPEFSIRLAEIE
jgi:hypothetical protein